MQDEKSSLDVKSLTLHEAEQCEGHTYLDRPTHARIHTPARQHLTYEALLYSLVRIYMYRVSQAKIIVLRKLHCNCNTGVYLLFNLV